MKMLKQYLIAKTFTWGDTPLEYVYTTGECDMRTKRSRKLAKYTWPASTESLFRLVVAFDFKIRVDVDGDLRLIAPNVKKAWSFLHAIHLLKWEGKQSSKTLR